MDISVSFAWEVQLITYIQSHLGDTGIFLMSFFTEFGDKLALVGILGFLYWAYDRKFGVYVALCTLSNLVFNSMIKNVFLRRRPYFDHEEIKVLKKVDEDADAYDILAQGFSFPSGHSSNASSVYSALYVYTKKKRILFPAVLLSLLVGISRFSLGVHYPTDVIAGLLEGLLTTLLITKFYEKTEKKKLYLYLYLISLSGCLFCRSTDYFSALGLIGGYLLGDLYTERFHPFEGTKVPWKACMRVILGALLFLFLHIVLKLPFSESFLNSHSALSFLERTLHFTFITFVLIGIYPHLFDLLHL